MDNNDIEFEEFLKWIGHLEDIPLQTRYNMFQHITQTGGIDQKTHDFMKETLENLKIKTDQKIKDYEQMGHLIGNVLAFEQYPQVSVKEKITHGAEEQMMDLVSDFKEFYYTSEQQKSDQAESLESADDQAEVEALKAGLGQ